MPNTVPLGLEWSQSMMLSLERRMREADVGSQSADTIKLSFRRQLV
jgi:hypothetical protein